MKKIICFLLAIAMSLSICACDSRTRRPSGEGSGTNGKPDSSQAGAENGDEDDDDGEDDGDEEEDDEPSSVMRLPSWVYERKESSTTTAEDERTGVNFYYDNTRSMYPFVCNEAGKSSNQVTGALVGVMKAMRVLLQQDTTDNRVYTLQEGGTGDDTLRWREFNGELHDHFGTKDFYTFKGELPKENGTKQGPLSQLYFNGGLDPKDVNIVLTDLAEQGVNNTALASAINNNILAMDGCAAAVIAFQCDFNGEAIVPDPGKVSQTLKGNIYGQRPLYLIITGPAKETSAAYKVLCDALKEFLKEGKDYFAEYQEIGTKVTRLKDNEIICAPVLVEMSDRQMASSISTMTVNDTLGFLSLDRQELKNLLPENLGNDGYVDVALNGFAAPEKKAYKQKRRVLNYYIPLKNYDKDLFSYRIAGSLEEEKTSDSVVDAILEYKDYMKFSILQNTDRQKEPAYLWKNGNKSDFDALFTIKSRLVPGGVLEGAEDLEKRNDFALAAEDQVDLTDYKMWLQVTVETNEEKFPGESLLFDIPVYASMATREIKPLPQWVEDYNAPAGSDKETYLTHTTNLTGFISTLFALNTNQSEDLYLAEQEVKIADIVTLVTGLKTKR